MQLLIWVLRLSTAVILALAESRPEYDPIHLWDSPHSHLAKVYCGTMLACEVLASNILADLYVVVCLTMTDFRPCWYRYWFSRFSILHPSDW